MPPPMTAGTPNTTKVPNLLLMFIFNQSPLNTYDYQKEGPELEYLTPAKVELAKYCFLY